MGGLASQRGPLLKEARLFSGLGTRQGRRSTSRQSQRWATGPVWG